MKNISYLLNKVDSLNFIPCIRKHVIMATGLEHFVLEIFKKSFGLFPVFGDNFLGGSCTIRHFIEQKQGNILSVSLPIFLDCKLINP